MKKVIYSLLLICVFLIPSKVFAVSGKINLSCNPAAAYPGDVVTCTIAGDVSDGSVNSFTAKTSLSDNLEYISSTVVSDWKGSSSNGLFSLETTSAQSESFEIASFTVKLKSDFSGNGTITVTPTKFGDVTKLEPVTATINLASTTTTEETTTTTDDNTDIKNPDTGSSIPFMIIGTGIIVGIAGFFIANRSKKIYKI